MELTPQLLTEIDFREQWRGYDKGDVDDFLERVAIAVGELQQRLRDASERAAQAERKLLERADDDEIRRTLVLAQRTAASALEEARAEAERILAEAEERAMARTSEAEDRLAALEADIAERTRTDLGALAERRAALEAELDALRATVEEHRSRLRDELLRQLAELDSPGSPFGLPAPAAAAPADEVGRAREELQHALQHVEGTDDAVDREDDGDDEPEPAEVDEDATGVFDAVADEDDDGEQVQGPGEAQPSPDSAAAEGPVPHDDDPFLAELRRAVTDTEPLGPRDHEPGDEDGVDHDDPSSPGRFRLRRSR